MACSLINIWKDYGDRNKGIVTTVKHGSKGTLLERKGARCKVRVGEAIGFVTYYFILEEKGAWLSNQLGFEGVR